jgi:hypothetical protein
MLIRALSAAAFLLAAPAAFAQTAAPAWPNLKEGDFVLKDYRFASGETMPDLKLHYRTLGTEKRDASGSIINGVLLLHGTSGVGSDWLRPSLGNELFSSGQASTHRNISSFCRMASAAADRASRATGCAENSRTTATATSSKPNTG